MKKRLLLLLTCVLTLFGLAHGAEKKVKFDFNSSNYGLPPYVNNNTDYVKNPTTISQEDIELTFTTATNKTNSWRMWSDGLRAMAKSSDPIFTVSTKVGKITKVEISAIPTFKVIDYKGNANITTWEGSAECVTFVCTSSGNEAVKTIEITYETGKQAEPIDYILDSNIPKTMKIGDTYTINLGNPTPKNFQIIAVDDEIATITDNAPYIITAKGEGTAEFMASWEADENYTQNECYEFSISINKDTEEGEIKEVLIPSNFSFTSSSKEGDYKDVTYTSELTNITYYGNVAVSTQNGEQCFQVNTTNTKGIKVSNNPNNYKVVSITITPTTTNNINVYSSETPFSLQNNNELSGTATGYCKQDSPIFKPDNDIYYWGIKSGKNANYFPSIIVIYKKEPSKPELTLGDIEYSVTGGKTIDQDEITVDLGDIFTFTAENAESMTVLVNSDEYDEEPFELTENNGKFSWTVEKVYELAMVDVTATLGDTTKDFSFMLTVNEPTPQLPIVSADGEALENNGNGVIAKGAEVTITAENAKSIIVTKDGEEVTQLTETPFKFTVNESGKYIFVGKNGENKSEAFIYTFTVGEVDPNMPVVGSNFRQISNVEELVEGYYVIAKVNGTDSESTNYAMSTSTGMNNTYGNNITASQKITAQEVVTWDSTSDNIRFNLVTVESPEILILKLEQKDGEWGIKTVNYGNSLVPSQKYLYHGEKANDLSLGDDFTPVSISFTQQKNVTIQFKDVESTNIIALSSNNNYFGYYSSGSIQLYQYTTANVFDPKFEDLFLEEGDEHEITLPEGSPEVSYKKTGKSVATTIITIEGNKIIANRNDERIEAEVEASWGHSATWFAGKARFKVSVLVTPELEFRYDVIRGKKDVGVAAQAVYYNGDAPGIKYSVWYDGKQVNPSEIDIDEETGMIRPDGIVNAVIGREYTVRAEVERTGIYKAASAEYILIIEKPEEGGLSLISATYNFFDNNYGMFTGFTSDTTGGSGSYGKYFEHNINEIEPSHVPVSSLEETPVTLDLFGNYRYFYYFADGFHEGADNNQLRVYKGTTMKFSVPDGYSIKNITFNGKDATNKYLSTTTSGTWTDGSTMDGYTKWNSSNENITEVLFTNKSGNNGTNLNIFTITLELSAPSSNDESAELAFDVEKDNEGKYFINAFVGEEITLPSLKHNENLKFEDVVLDLDPFSEDDDAEIFQNYTKNFVDYENLAITVNEPGIYTLRAKYEGEDFLNGMAILRLNVFPRLTVTPQTPDEAAGGQLADDRRTDSPDLTLVKPDPTTNKATITMPNLAELNDDFKYSTVTIDRVEIKHGDDLHIYQAQPVQGVRGRLVDGSENYHDISELKETYEFENDGYVKYNIVYANHSDFSKETTVYVYLMPQTPTYTESAADKTITLTPSQNAHLEFKYGILDAEGNWLYGLDNEVATVAETTWPEVGADATVSTEVPEGVEVPAGQRLGLRALSVKDIDEETLGNISNVEDGRLESQPAVIALTDVEYTFTIGTFGNSEWSNAATGNSFDKIISYPSSMGELDNLSDYLDITVTPNFETASQPSSWSAGAGMPVWLWNQMKAITATEGNRVDGYYSDAEVSISKPSEGDNDYAANVNVIFACSGQYTITIAPKEGMNVTLKDEASAQQTFDIYPSFTNVYSYTLDENNFVDDGLTINSTGKMTLNSSDNSYELQYPAPEGNLYYADKIDESVLIVPGLYLADLYYNKSEVSGSSSIESLGKKAANLADYTQLEDNYMMDLSGLTSLVGQSSGQLSLKLMAKKNKAETPQPTEILIILNSNMLEPTGVEGIGSEDGEAEYFDLNGFKVNADRLEKGIYIKVQNGTATKVLVK